MARPGQITSAVENHPFVGRLLLAVNATFVTLTSPACQTARAG
jgi:hypothetical protein